MTLFYIYSIKTCESIGNRRRIRYQEERERSNGILCTFLDYLEKTYPKGNFLKIFYSTGLPSLLVTDTKICELEVSVFSHQRHAVPYGERVRLIQESHAKSYISFVREDIMAEPQSISSRNYYLEDTSGCYKFGPKSKEVFKNLKSWKKIAGTIAQYF